MAAIDQDRKKVTDLQKALETVSPPPSRLVNRSKREVTDNQAAASRPREAGSPPHHRRGRGPQHHRGGDRRQVRRDLPNLPLCPRGYRDPSGRSPKAVRAQKERRGVRRKSTVNLPSHSCQPGSIASPFSATFRPSFHQPQPAPPSVPTQARLRTTFFSSSHVTSSSNTSYPRLLLQSAASPPSLLRLSPLESTTNAFHSSPEKVSKVKGQEGQKKV